MKKIIPILLSTLLIPCAWAEPKEQTGSPLEIYEDINDHAKNVINGQNKNYDRKHKELSETVSGLTILVSDDPQMKSEVKDLQQSLTELEKVKLLRSALKEELKSEPTADEVMKLYFELKATEDIKSASKK